MISENFCLKNHNTFGVDIKAENYAALPNEQEILTLISSGITRETNTLILGGGSNILFINDFKGIVLHPLIKGIVPGKSSGNKISITVGSGVIWDDFVEWAVTNGLWGTENLSLIPGNTGATAVQNIGAYGVEAAGLIESVHTIELSSGKKMLFTNSECNFSYRNSIFKSELKGKHIITSVSFSLSQKPEFNISYGNLSQEIEETGPVSLSGIRSAVIKIRKSKLPNPSEIGNAGSFFKNPVLSEASVLALLTENPSMPVYPAGEGTKKVAAGWLIEQCGWKGFRRGDAGVHVAQALVLVNYGSATGTELLALSEEIRESVFSRFGVNLEREVEIV